MAELSKTEKIKKKSSPLCWDFPSTNGGEEDGFSDPLLEYFQGDHEKYIARETIQNAIDVRVDYLKPVRVEFEHFEMAVDDIPGYKDILDKIKRCFDFVKKQNQDRAENFFRSAIEMMEKKKIPVLKISDFNTLGLSGGDKDREGGLYRLVKAVGTSSPKGVSGGSFGIGKGAPIAASGIRAVFYSAVDELGSPVFQGKARLVSHYNKEDDVRRGVGFYGINGYQSVRDINLILPLFRRKERGTDIYIMGYATQNSWQEGLIKSVLDNFWLAIHCGDLEVKIKDGSEFLITKENLKELLDKLSPNDAMPFYLAVVNRDNYFQKSLDTLGNVQLFVKKRDDFPSLVMLARKPKMMVQVKHYKALRDPYAAVFICEDDKGNLALRDLEPPAHNEWNRDLAQKKELGRAIIKEMDKFIKDSLHSLSEIIDTEPQDIPGLDKYLPDSDFRDYETQNNNSPSERSNLSGDEESSLEVGAIKDSSVEEAEKTLRRSVIVKIPGSGTGPGPGGKNGSGGGSGLGNHGGDEEGEEGERIRTADISFRSFVEKNKNGIEYHLIISGRENCQGSVRLIAVGDDGSYPVEIKTARNLDTKETYVVDKSLIKGLSVPKGQTIKLGVGLASKKKYAIGIENYEC
ncbi:MAG: hypothetical protein WC845_03870 [Candidatus Staskawiczbacteria bacterium]|jgi:hypothetical protein